MTSVIDAILEALILYLIGSFLKNPQYNNIYILIGIIIFLLLIKLVIKYLYNYLENHFKKYPLMEKIFDLLRTKIETWKAILLIVLVVVSVLIVSTYMFPPSEKTESKLPEKTESKLPFVIIEPKEGSYVKLISTVSGQGAIPDSTVNIYVVDKYGKKWNVGSENSTEDGLWKCDGVNIGQFGKQYTGQKFTLFASSTTDNIYEETPHINVTRS